MKTLLHTLGGLLIVAVLVFFFALAVGKCTSSSPNAATTTTTTILQVAPQAQLTFLEVRWEGLDPDMRVKECWHWHNLPNEVLQWFEAPVEGVDFDPPLVAGFYATKCP